MNTNENIIDVSSKTYICQNCKSKNVLCNKCNTILKDDNFYPWLALTRLVGNPGITIRYSENASGKAIKLIELLKAVGLTEKKKKQIFIDCIRLDLRCKCGNTLIFIQEDDRERSFVCMKCKTSSFGTISKSKIKIEKTEVQLEKLPAVIALTEE